MGKDVSENSIEDYLKVINIAATWCDCWRQHDITYTFDEGQ